MSQPKRLTGGVLRFFGIPGLVIAAQVFADVSAPPVTPSPTPPLLVSSALVHKLPTGRAPLVAEWPQPAAAVAPGDLSDEQVNLAIHHAVDFLLTQYKDGRIATADPSLNDTWREGLDALCAYALLSAGQTTRDPRLSLNGPFMTDVLDKLNAANMEGDVSGRWGPVVYARSLRAMALAINNRPEDRETLQDDAVWLVNAEVLGGYFYDDRYSQGRGHQSELPDPPPPESEKPHRVVARDLGQERIPVSVKPGPTDHKPTPGKPVSTGPRPPYIESPPWPVLPPFPPPPPWPIQMPPPRMPPRPPQITTGPPISQPPRKTAPPKPGTNKPSGGGFVDPACLSRGKFTDKDPVLNRDEVPWDNSNSQYGVLGVQACAECGIEIPGWYWKDVEYHWARWQMKDGGWGYRQASTFSTLAMTSAGVSALRSAAEWTTPSGGGAAFGREASTPQVAAGIAWLDHGDNSVAMAAPGSRFTSYDLLSLQRAATAIGFKHLGGHEWYRELAAMAVFRQAPDGSWGGAGGNQQGAQDRIIETAYTLLFLSRGQHPVIMNKLRFTGHWANRPHDLSNLSRYVAKTLERGVSWQVVGLDRDWTDWLDAPIVYIASQQAPELTDADVSKLRHFAEAGGMIFTHADAGSAAFNTWAADLAKKLWPAYELKTLPDDHDVYTMHSKLSGRPHVKLQGVSNGSRLLMVHAPADMASAWEMRAEKSRADQFQLAMNLFAYATSKSDLRRRLDVPYLLAPDEAPKRMRTVKIARLAYDGAWDPEPLAWTRFSHWLQRRSGIVAVSVLVDLASLKPNDAPVAHLTGTSAHTFTRAEADALRAYVQAGGVLLIDSCGGGTFAESVKQSALGVAFADVKFATVDAADPLLASKAGAEDLSTPRYRTFVLSRNGAKPPVLPIEHAAVGQGHVYVSSIDVTSGLLGTQAWGIFGFDPDYATALVNNLVMMATDSGK